MPSLIGKRNLPNKKLTRSPEGPRRFRIALAPGARALVAPHRRCASWMSCAVAPAQSTRSARYEKTYRAPQRTYRTDIGNDREATNLELVLVAGCILVGLAVAVGFEHLGTEQHLGDVPANSEDCKSATTPVDPQDKHVNAQAHRPQPPKHGHVGGNTPTGRTPD